MYNKYNNRLMINWNYSYKFDFPKNEGTIEQNNSSSRRIISYSVAPPVTRDTLCKSTQFQIEDRSDAKSHLRESNNNLRTLRMHFVYYLLHVLSALRFTCWAWFEREKEKEGERERKRERVYRPLPPARLSFKARLAELSWEMKRHDSIRASRLAVPLANWFVTASRVNDLRGEPRENAVPRENLIDFAPTIKVKSAQHQERSVGIGRTRDFANKLKKFSIVSLRCII